MSISCAIILNMNKQRQGLCLESVGDETARSKENALLLAMIRREDEWCAKLNSAELAN